MINNALGLVLPRKDRQVEQCGGSVVPPSALMQTIYAKARAAVCNDDRLAEAPQMALVNLRESDTCRTEPGTHAAPFACYIILYVYTLAVTPSLRSIIPAPGRPDAHIRQAIILSLILP